MADGRAEEQAARRAANLRLGVGVACVGVAAAILYANRMFYHDDAFITLRYARNFLAGDGLVWNPGEAVQGYTNFLFLLGVGAVGFRASGKQSSTRDYFLGGRSIPWWAASLSIIATETSAVTYIGTPAMAYQGNWNFLQLVFGFVLGRIFLATFMVRIFYRREFVTVYGFLEERYGNATRVTASFLFLCGRVVASAVRLFAGCIAIHVATGIQLENVVVGLGVFGA